MSHHTYDPVCARCEEFLTQTHQDLAYWYRFNVKAKYPDFHIACSYRDKEDQEHAVAMGASKLHYPKSAHNHTDHMAKPCALALDLFQINEKSPRGIWNPQAMAKIYADCEEREDPIIWGGKFKSLGDSGHFQWKPDDLG